MKIAFLTPRFPKYSETFIINQVCGLLELGHEVTVFSLGQVDSPANHSILDKFDLEKRANYVKEVDTYRDGIKEYLNTILGPSTMSDIIDAIKYGKKGPQRLACRNSLYRLQEEFDIFHAHFGPVARHWDFINDQAGQAPFVATYYGYDVTKFLHPNNYDFYERAGHWESVDLAIGISEHIRSKMMMAGCPEQKSTTLPIGIDPDLFQFSPTRYNHNKPLQLLSTCRHTEKKGVGYAIQAVSLLNSRGVDVTYTIAGEGELTPYYQDLVSQEGLENEIEFVGRIPQETVAELMQKSHLYLQPSVTASNGDMEGQGLVFQEAQATGTPPISTFHNGIPEGVRHAETGRLTPERDISRIADEIEYFVEHPGKIEQYAKRGRELIESKYNFMQIAQEQEKIYKDML